MQELSWDDVPWAVRRLPKPVRDLLQRHGRKVFLAGGYLRAVIANERVADVDLFAPSKDYAEACAKELANPEGRRPRRLIETDNAYTVILKPFPAQFIHRWTFTDPAAALESFDFTIAQAALWWDAEALRWAGACSDRFYQDLAAKRLVYTSPNRNEEAGGSMLRVLKFYQRGYRIPLDSLGAVVARLVRGIEPTKFATDQVAKVITGLLREVDPLIDPNHAAHLPSATDPPGDPAEDGE